MLGAKAAGGSKNHGGLGDCRFSHLFTSPTAGNVLNVNVFPVLSAVLALELEAKWVIAFKFLGSELFGLLNKLV